MTTSAVIVRRTVPLLATIALFGASCGDDSPTDTATTVPDATSTTETTGTVADATAPDDGSTTIAPDADLPGEPFAIAPDAGRTLAVVGVHHDDTLNVRQLPGTDQPVVAELAPVAADFVASGRARALPSSIWWEITTADGVVGWVSSRFTAQVGPTADLTAQAVAAHGSTPVAETMAELGELTATALQVDPDALTDIVMSVAPTVGHLGEVTYDLVGLGDDAVAGLRLHVFGQPADSGEEFGLMSVEATDMCDPTRGPSTPGGVCA